MKDTHLIPSEALIWVMGNAQNELNAYLCEVDYRKINGERWPEMAREQASLCRSVATAARLPEDQKAWLTLAQDYEDTILPEG